MSERFPAGGNKTKEKPDADTRLRGSGTDWMRSSEQMSERFPPTRLADN